MTRWWVYPFCYTCRANVVFVGDPYEVSSVSQNHSEGESDETVLSLEIRNQNVKQAPRGFGKFFRNLAALFIYASQLENISFDDLSGLDNLVQIDLNYNNLIKLDPNVFDGNPGLTAIGLANNPSLHINHLHFVKLLYLEFLYVTPSKCTSISTANNRREVLKIMYELKMNCAPTAAQQQVLSENLVEEHRTDLCNRLATKIADIESRLAKCSCVGLIER